MYRLTIFVGFSQLVTAFFSSLLILLYTHLVKMLSNQKVCVFTVQLHCGYADKYSIFGVVNDFELQTLLVKIKLSMILADSLLVYFNVALWPADCVLPATAKRLHMNYLFRNNIFGLFLSPISHSPLVWNESQMVAFSVTFNELLILLWLIWVGFLFYFRVLITIHCIELLQLFRHSRKLNPLKL